MTRSDREELQAALVEQAEQLRGFIARQAPPSLTRFETVEDLYQSFASEVLARADRYEDRGPERRLGWLHEVARNFVRERQRHWMALKRGSGKVLRSGFGDPERASEFAGFEPAQSSAGPGSIAARREQLLLVAKALGLLLPRDRQIVEWSSEGHDSSELARRLDLTVDAAGKARQRALERLRKTHELVLRSEAAGR
ncbi:MAG: sigma-70 family RNA polymerase sigma factor [Planctomycetota bacterium]